MSFDASKCGKAAALGGLALLVGANLGCGTTTIAARPIVHVAAGTDCHGLQSAIDTASAKGSPGFGNSALVEVGAGTYDINCTVHLKSNAVIQLDKDAHITATAADFDPPETTPQGVSPNCADKGGSGDPNACQDEGHTILNTAMFRGDHVSNIGFVGSGSIDGGGLFTTGNSGPGKPDKLISISNCDHLVLSGIALSKGGHFEVLTNGCDQVVSDGLDIEAADQRDGWNVISVTHLAITNIIVHSSDDALVFKSDWALGKTLPNGPATVDHATLSAGCCNALMFGSETCGDFSDYHFKNITITGAGKSGIGIVSSDGAHESHLFYDNINMSGSLNALLTLRVWDRMRCGGNPGVGSISDVHFSNITASTTSNMFTPTMWGFDMASSSISNVTFDKVSLATPQDGGGDPDTLPSVTHDYNPKSIGPRPAYGMFMHDVKGVLFKSSAFVGGGAFPALDVIDGGDVCLDGVTLEASTGSVGDVHLKDVAGYSIVGSTRSGGGGPVSVTAVGSSASPVQCPRLPV